MLDIHAFRRNPSGQPAVAVQSLLSAVGMLSWAMLSFALLPWLSRGPNCSIFYTHPEHGPPPCRYGKELTVADVEALLTRHIRQQDIDFKHLARFYPRSAAPCPLLRCLRPQALGQLHSLRNTRRMPPLPATVCPAAVRAVAVCSSPAHAASSVTASTLLASRPGLEVPMGPADDLQLWCVGCRSKSGNDKATVLQGVAAQLQARGNEGAVESMAFAGMNACIIPACVLPSMSSRCSCVGAWQLYGSVSAAGWHVAVCSFLSWTLLTHAARQIAAKTSPRLNMRCCQATLRACRCRRTPCCSA